MAVTTALVGAAVVGAGASVYSAKKGASASQKAADTATGESSRQFDLVREDTAPLRNLGNSAISTINKLYGYSPEPAKPLSFEEFVDQSGGMGAFTTQIGRIRGPGELGARKAYDAYLSSQPPATPASSGPDMSVFFASPDYQFRLDETQKGLDRASAARGRFASGAALKEGSRYASNLASGEFASFYDRLAQQAGLGVTGIGQSAAAGANAANTAGNAAIYAGNARANSYASAASGVNSAVQGGISNYLLSRYLQPQPGVPG